MPNTFFKYNTSINCEICNNEFVRTSGKQKYCPICITSGKARKFTISKYYYIHRDRVLENQKKTYYKDIKHTREIKNKYGNSERGIAKQREFYKKNKDKIIERSYRWQMKYKPGKYRELAKKLMVNIPKICLDCGSVENINIHHVDGNFRNTVIENLVYVCRKCHGLRHRKLNLFNKTNHVSPTLRDKPLSP